MSTQTRIQSKVKKPRLMEVKISFRKNVEFDFEGEMINDIGHKNVRIKSLPPSS